MLVKSFNVIACALSNSDSREMFKLRSVFWGQPCRLRQLSQQTVYFFSFSLAKLRSYFYLLKDKIFSHIYISLQALRPQRHHHSNGWRHTVPVSPKLAVFFRVYVSGCRVLVFLFICFYDTCILNVFRTNKVYCVWASKTACLFLWLFI